MPTIESLKSLQKQIMDTAYQGGNDIRIQNDTKIYSQQEIKKRTNEIREQVQNDLDRLIDRFRSEFEAYYAELKLKEKNEMSAKATDQMDSAFWSKMQMLDQVHSRQEPTRVYDLYLEAVTLGDADFAYYVEEFYLPNHHDNLLSGEVRKQRESRLSEATAQKLQDVKPLQRFHVAGADLQANMDFTTARRLFYAGNVKGHESTLKSLFPPNIKEQTRNP